jgi:hypothetical protein
MTQNSETLERFWTIGEDGRAIEIELIEGGFGRDFVRNPETGIEWETSAGLWETPQMALGANGLL